MAKVPAIVVDSPVTEMSVNVCGLWHDGGVPAFAYEFQPLYLLLTLHVHPEDEFDVVL